MNIGKPRRVMYIEPVILPVPRPMPELVPVPELVPEHVAERATGSRDPVPAGCS